MVLRIVGGLGIAAASLAMLSFIQEHSGDAGAFVSEEVRHTLWLILAAVGGLSLLLASLKSPLPALFAFIASIATWQSPEASAVLSAAAFVYVVFHVLAGNQLFNSLQQAWVATLLFVAFLVLGISAVFVCAFQKGYITFSGNDAHLDVLFEDFKSMPDEDKTALRLAAEKCGIGDVVKEKSSVSVCLKSGAKTLMGSMDKQGMEQGTRALHLVDGKAMERSGSHD